MGFLSLLIPETFSGESVHLNSFLGYCDKAFKLASRKQKLPLLYFIQTKIKDPARSQIANHPFESWEELREKLKLLYSDKKNNEQYFEELCYLRQKKDEPVSTYHRRVEEITAKVLSSLNSSDQAGLPGVVEHTNRVALHRFIYHTHTYISTYLRLKGCKTLSEALSAALEQEQLNSYKFTNQNRQNQFRSNQSRPYQNSGSKFCKNCNRSGHETKECYKNSESRKVLTVKTCNYCKKEGHVIADCRKRTYNENKRRIGEQTSNNNSSGNKFCSNCKMKNHNTNECRKLAEKAKSLNLEAPSATSPGHSGMQPRGTKTQISNLAIYQK